MHFPRRSPLSRRGPRAPCLRRVLARQHPPVPSGAHPASTRPPCRAARPSQHQRAPDRRPRTPPPRPPITTTASRPSWRAPRRAPAHPPRVRQVRQSREQAPAPSSSPESKTLFGRLARVDAASRRPRRTFQPKRWPHRCPDNRTPRHPLVPTIFPPHAHRQLAPTPERGSQRGQSGASQNSHAPRAPRRTLAKSTAQPPPRPKGPPCSTRSPATAH